MLLALQTLSIVKPYNVNQPSSEHISDYSFAFD